MNNSLERFVALLVFKDKEGKFKDARLIETDYKREQIIKTIGRFKTFICKNDCDKDSSQCYKCDKTTMDIDHYLDWACTTHDIYEMEPQGLSVYNNIEI